MLDKFSKKNTDSKSLIFFILVFFIKLLIIKNVDIIIKLNFSFFVSLQINEKKSNKIIFYLILKKIKKGGG